MDFMGDINGYTPLVKHGIGKSLCLMGTSSISMAIFNSYGSHYRRVVSFANSVRFHDEWNNWFG